MERKRKKIKIIPMTIFVFGLFLYIVGLLLLFFSSIGRSSISKLLFFMDGISDELILNFKIFGAILFIIGFVLFMLAVIFLYKNDDIVENNRNLIIEGKADVITIIVMTYVMIFMIVLCLLYNEMVGALLFGLTIVIQSILNTVLIKYYSKSYKR